MFLCPSQRVRFSSRGKKEVSMSAITRVWTLLVKMNTVIKHWQGFHIHYLSGVDTPGKEEHSG